MEWEALGQHLEQHESDGVEVTALVETLTARKRPCLLRRRVARLADELADTGERRVLVGAVRIRERGARDAEVDDLHQRPRRRRRDHHVLGRQIAVHDAHLVRVAEPGADLHADATGLFDSERALLAHQRREALPDHVLHHEEVIAVLDEEVVEQDQVRVAQLHRNARLALEALDGLRQGVEQLGAHHFQRARLAQQAVLGLVDRAHAAAPDPLEHAEVPDLPPEHRIRRLGVQNAGRTFGRIGHRASCRGST